MKYLNMFFVLSILLLSSIRLYATVKSISSEKGIKAEIIQELTEAEEKISSLAQDFPEEKYSWRPEEGVRSVSEVINHVGGANFFF